jgi:F-type H+-transporting ATPase subunit gamma
LANARVIVKRRKSVRNIRKITRTMQLIATARFQSAFARAMATKPYVQRLAALAADLSAAAGEGVSHPLLQARPEPKRAALVVLTSVRGLCGGYNTSVLRAAIAHLHENERKNLSTDVYMIGKKGINYFKFLRRETVERIAGLADPPKFEQAQMLANTLMERFVRGEIDEVAVAYMRFLSAGRQAPHVLQLLPLAQETKSDAETPRARTVQYEFSPDPKELLEDLLPATVRIQLFQCFNDALVSEQTARMVAMKAATESAGEMITDLTRKYNRARQTQITMELLDIVGGANALQ